MVEDVQQRRRFWRIGARPYRSAGTAPHAGATGDRGRRHKFPNDRHAITGEFDIPGREGYTTSALRGRDARRDLPPYGEGGVHDQSLRGRLRAGDQLRAPALQDLVDEFRHVRFEPSGMTRNPDVRFAKSIVDYLSHWMAPKFYESPFTDINPRGPEGVFTEPQVDELVSVLKEIRQTAAA